MDVETFNEFADFALQGSGQHIPASKSYLIDARLSPIIRREGFSSAQQLADCLKARPNKVLEKEIIAALTTKTTRFFDERDGLEYIVDEVLPQRKEAGAERLRVLCAGGSTGQEAYSLAMLLEETPGSIFGDTPIDIVSIDVCGETTERARSGHFGHFEVQRGLSIQRLLKNFKRQEDGGWQINDDFRLRIGFRNHNLLEPVDVLGQFDAIICRNVFPSMAKPVRASVAEQLAAQIIPGGALLIGENETLPFVSDSFASVEEHRNIVIRVTAEAAVAAA